MFKLDQAHLPFEDKSYSPAKSTSEMHSCYMVLPPSRRKKRVILALSKLMTDRRDHRENKIVDHEPFAGSATTTPPGGDDCTRYFPWENFQGWRALSFMLCAYFPPNEKQRKNELNNEITHCVYCFGVEDLIRDHGWPPHINLYLPKERSTSSSGITW